MAVAIFLFSAAPLFAAPSTTTAAAPEPPAPVYVMEFSGAIDPAVARYFKQGLEKALQARAQMVLVRMDTPGGLLDATRDIIQSMLNAPVPVVFFVGPRGARATSAGVFLMMASDVAAMAPETHLGAAHPVSLGGGGVDASSSSSVMSAKAASDAAAYIRGLAADKGRNAAWAERAVRESVSLTADEAFDQEVADVVAEDEDELFLQLQDGTVEKNGTEYVLSPMDAPRVELEMSGPLKLLHVLANPNLAYILLMVGVYALLYEFATPGVGFGGVTGLICLVLAFFSLQVLPLNYAGLALLVAGLAMMATDHALGGHGLLMAGGIIAFGIGSLMLYDRAEPYVRVSLPLVAGSVAAAAAFSAVVLRGAWAVRRMKPVTGREALEGRIGEVRRDGLVFLEGQLWTADGYGPFQQGEKVRVLGVEGNKLRIEKL
jgi:membrane-bound serine protease (ClpP class)